MAAVGAHYHCSLRRADVVVILPRERDNWWHHLLDVVSEEEDFLVARRIKLLPSMEVRWWSLCAFRSSPLLSNCLFLGCCWMELFSDLLGSRTERRENGYGWWIWRGEEANEEKN